MARRGRGGYSLEELAQLRAGVVRNGDMSSISRDIQERVNAERDARIRKEQADSALNQARAAASLGARSELISGLERIRNRGKTRKPLRRAADLEDRRRPTPRTPTYSDDYFKLREILGTGIDFSRGPRQGNYMPSRYEGIDGRDVVEYENLKNRYRDTYGKDYSEIGGSSSKPVGPRSSIGARNGRYAIRDIRPVDFVPGRPAVGYEQPGVNFREALEGKTSKQDKPTITSEKSKAFGDLLKRMKRF
jgi:hypothetical protein